ncbi:MAG: hypothetical protein KatS3mg115_1879 [Candidatus Poribacteria bacterium]|nr:MAG: hypothetical protein KatS3mg115_1879 [Candidatus Poribacteria bacterium]
MRRSRLKTWLSPILILAFLGAGEVEAQHPPTPPVPSSNGAEAMQALQAAERHYFQNDYEAAVRALSEYIAQYPDSPYLNQAYLRLGQSYDRLEEDAKARQAFAQAVALEPNDPLAMQAVSYWGNLYVRRYQYLEAAAMCETVMRTYPKTRAAEMAHYLLGNYYYAANRIEQAIQAYRSFLEEHVGSIYFRSAFRQLISLLLLDDRAAEAEAFLDRFLSDSPDDAQLIEQLAEVYRRQKRYEDAVRLLSGALAKRPNDTALWQALGEVYAEQGDRQAAREVWSQMAQHGEASYSTYQQLGMLYRRYEYFDEAAEAFRKAIQMQPGYAYLYIQLAEVYAIQGKREEALRVYLDALLQIGPIYANRASLVSALSELFPPERLKERLAEAEAKLRERSGQSQDANLILTLAELNLILGRVDQAIKDFERLAALFPDRGQLLVQYAQQYREAHDLRTARALYEAAVRLFPEASRDAALVDGVGRDRRAGRPMVGGLRRLPTGPGARPLRTDSRGGERPAASGPF